jgi:predicted small metal-binding protein
MQVFCCSDLGVNINFINDAGKHVQTFV